MRLWLLKKQQKQVLVHSAIIFYLIILVSCFHNFKFQTISNYIPRGVILNRVMRACLQKREEKRGSFRHQVDRPMLILTFPPSNETRSAPPPPRGDTVGDDE